MKIKEIKLTIGELIEDYTNLDDEGVTAYGGKLNIRPKYQREFIYSIPKQEAVIDTILKDFPLNTMYWVKTGKDHYEILDGQQRTMSICEYYKNEFSFKYKTFDNQPDDIKKQFLKYQLHIYICEGSDSERLEWFRTINIAGEPLTDQELRNANFTGDWLISAKSYFSKKNNCPATKLFGDYLVGQPNRQDYLETVLSWLVQYLNIEGKDPISAYMGQHQNDKDASELISYFNEVQKWVKATFIDYYKEMKGLPWGILYNKFHKTKFDSKKLSLKINELMSEEDIDAKKGIFQYVLDGDESHLHLRAFTSKDKRTMYEKQHHKCADCGQPFKIEEMEAHHVKRFSDGGPRDISNGVMLCQKCHDIRHRMDAKRGLNK